MRSLLGVKPVLGRFAFIRLLLWLRIGGFSGADVAFIFAFMEIPKTSQLDKRMQ